MILALRHLEAWKLAGHWDWAPAVFASGIPKYRQHVLGVVI